MKERPILFSAPMVRAVLEGRKTQTRRVIKPQPTLTDNGGFVWKGSAYGLGSGHRETQRNFSKHCCPYGQPGERLWVRETHAVFYGAPYDDGKSDDVVVYRADHGDSVEANFAWKPSIHMPRWASRIDLEITGVRVERLNDISERDAINEGIERIGGNFCISPWKNYRKGEDGEMQQDCSAPSRSFMTLWESINGADSWKQNPWVWVVEFKAIKPVVQP
jgi:hypothetical protein